MIIKSIELKDFRNYKDLSIGFDPGTNILYGDNAQGKTNLLEAIYLSGTSKSYKGARDREMIRFGAEEAHIKTIVGKGDNEFRIDVHLKKNNKGIAINLVPIKKTGDMFGILRMVFFSPEDLNIIKNGPQERRKFIDNELCQLDRVYLSNLKNYYKILDQRNKLLKDIYFNPDLKDTLPVWDEQLVNYGVQVIKTRRNFIKDLSAIAEKIHSGLTKGEEKMEISYDCDSTEDNFSERLFLNEDRDLKLENTSAGPHRDDLSIKINGIDMRKFGSQGQQRTCALSLKFSEIKFMELNIHEKPVLLLDDVLSELDKNRQYDLLDSLSDIQTIITCTGLEDFVEHRFELDKIFHVVNGTISDYEL